MAPFLSIVIPAYNEARRMPDALERCVRFLREREYAWEVVVVDDGSQDDTAAVVSERAAADDRIRLLGVGHGGKGWAARHGMLAAEGAYRFLCDADLSMPIEQVERFIPPRLQGAEVAIGSREAPGARRFHEPVHRHLMGRAFNWPVRRLATPGLSDTQCGFKCFRADAVEGLFRRQRLRGFGFDVEVLFLALRAGYRVVQVPIDWYYRSDSRVRPLRDAGAMLLDLARVRYNAWRGRYGEPPQLDTGGAPAYTRRRNGYLRRGPDGRKAVQGRPRRGRPGGEGGRRRG